MDQILANVRRKQKEMIAFLKDLVECESPSNDPKAIRRFCELFSGRISDIADCRFIPGGKFGPHLQCDFRLPGDRKKGQILALGHSDTVYSIGTLAKMPFRSTKGRLMGPGVLDMKAGLVFVVSAMRTLRDLNIPVARNIRLQVNSDEEVGSETSRPLTEKEARRSVAVLVLEPGQGIDGKLKTARKGVGDYKVLVKGKSAHAGVDFSAGASAIVELARQIERITTFTDLKRGMTVNPGVISGGTRTNVIAAEALAEVDIRIARMKDAAVLDRKFHSLRPFDKRCSIEVSGGMNRPPMERSAGIVSLFRKAQALALDLDVKLEESSTGGGSDGNFTAGVGTPTLDGLGGVGEGAHSPGEYILIERIADRTALLAKLVQAI
jgi:glutamate carboxypeptidase